MLSAPNDSRFLVFAKAIVFLLGLILFPVVFIDAFYQSPSLSAADLRFFIILHLASPAVGFFAGAIANIIAAHRYANIGAFPQTPRFAPSAPESLAITLEYQWAAEQFQDQRADYDHRSSLLEPTQGSTANGQLRAQYLFDCYKLAVSCALYGVERAIKSAFPGDRLDQP